MSTVTGALVGSPAYMSPEQARGEKGVDHRSDLWSFGVVLFEMIAGRRPFPSTSMRVITEITEDAIPTLGSVVPGVDPRLDAIVSRCLTRDVALRMPSAQALLDALRELAAPADLGASRASPAPEQESVDDYAPTALMPRNLVAALRAPSNALTTVAGDAATEATLLPALAVADTGRAASSVAVKTIELAPIEGEAERSTIRMAPPRSDPAATTAPLPFTMPSMAPAPAAPRFGAPPSRAEAADAASAAVTTPFIRPPTPPVQPGGVATNGLRKGVLVGLGVAAGVVFAALVLLGLTLTQQKPAVGPAAPSAAPFATTPGPVPSQRQ
jgi:serine/threonine-protein kinase